MEGGRERVSEREREGEGERSRKNCTKSVNNLKFG